MNFCMYELHVNHVFQLVEVLLFAHHGQNAFAHRQMCCVQVMRVVVKQMVTEWHQQLQSRLPDVTLFTAMQLSFDLHFFGACLQPYTTPAGARLLQTCRSLLAQAAAHRLCDRSAQCQQVREAFGDHTTSQSVAAWLSQLGMQVVQQASSHSFFVTQCLLDGAQAGQAAMSAPAPVALTRIASTNSVLSPYSSGIDVPASPRRRLVASKPAPNVQSRLIGKTASSAAALAALQGKYAMPSMPRSPTIKALHQAATAQSAVSLSFPSSVTLTNQSTSGFQSADLPETRHLKHKPSRLRTPGSSTVQGLHGESRTGSILGPKDRLSRHRPPVLQLQSSISLNAFAAIRKSPPLQA